MVLDRLRRVAAMASTWGRVSARTAAYASASCLTGPFTRGKSSQWLFRRYCRASIRQLKIAVDTDGIEIIDRTAPCILVANHNSLLDIPVIGSVLSVDHRWVAKRSLFFIPFMGWHLALAGHIPIDRKRRNNLEKLDAGVANALGEGACVLFFPEGTRSPDGALRRFRSGAFISAVRHDVPVVPIVLEGTQRLLTKGSAEFDNEAERRIPMQVLEPLVAVPDGDDDQRGFELRNRTREAMAAALDHLRGAPGGSERPVG